MDIGTIEGALKLKNEASAVLKQFETDAVSSASSAASAIATATQAIVANFGNIQQAAQQVSSALPQTGQAAQTAQQGISAAQQAANASAQAFANLAAQAANTGQQTSIAGQFVSAFAQQFTVANVAATAAKSVVFDFTAELLSLAKAVAGIPWEVFKAGASNLRESINAAEDFQTSLTKIINLTDETKASVGAMGEQVLGLAGKVGRGPQELADALYFVAGAGIHGQQAMDVLTNSAQASAIGLGKTQDVAHALTGVLNAFQGQNLSAAEATRVLIATVNEGNIEADELAHTLGRVVGQAGEVGASFADVGAFIATFTRVGVNANESVTALRGLLSTLIKPAKQSREALEEIGLSVDQLRQSVREKGLTQTLLDLYQAFDGNLDAMGKVIPNVRALAGFLATAGEQGKQFKEIQEKINDAMHDGNYVTERMANLQQTLGFQWQSLKADVEAASIVIGQQFLPAMTEIVRDGHEVVNVIGDIAKGFASIGGKVATLTVDLTLGQLKGVKGAIDLANAPGGIAGAIGAMIADQFSAGAAPKIDIPLIPEIGAAPLPNISDVLARQTDGLHNYVAQLADARGKIAELSDANKEQLAAALKLGGDAAKQAAKDFNLDEAAIRVFTETQKDFTKGTTAASKAAVTAEESYAKMFNALTGNDAIRKANEMVTVLQNLGSTKLIDPAQAGNVAKTLQDGIDAAARFGETTREAFGTDAGEVQRYVTELQKIATTYKEQQDFGKLTLQTAKTDIKAVADEVGGWFTQQSKLNTELEKAQKAVLAQQLDKQSKQFQQYAKDILKASDELDKLNDEFGNVTDGSKDLYQELIRLKQTELDGYFERLLTRTPELRGAIEGLSVMFGGLGSLAAEAWQATADGADKAAPKVKTSTDDLKQLASAFSNLATVSSGAFSSFAKGVGEIISTAEIGVKAGQTFLKGFSAATTPGNKDWATITDNLVGGLISGIGAVGQATGSASLLQNIIGGGLTGAQIGTSIGTAVGFGIAAEIGASTAKGAAIGGVWGAAAGAIVGIIIAVWRSAGTRSAMKQVGQEWGVSISEGLADKLNDLGDSVSGGVDTASILHMAEILKEAGGVTSTNIDQFLPKLHDVFSFLERGQITASQAQGVLNDNFAKFADVIVGIGKVAPRAFADVVRLNQELGVNSQAVVDFVAGQTGKLGSSIAALIKPLTDLGTTTAKNVSDAQTAVDQLVKDGKEGSSDWKAAVDRLNSALASQQQAAIGSQAEFERLGTIALSAFNTAVAGGLSVYQTMVQIGPSIDALILAQQQLGLSSDNAALSELEHFRQMIQQNQTLAAAAGALGDTLVTLSTIGGLNIDTFKALEEQGVDTFNKLIAAGFTDKEALATIQSYLLDVIDAHNELGLPIDENTQALIDQAKEYGLLKDNAKSTTQIMQEGFDKVVDALDRIAIGLGVDIPAAAAAATDAINNIPTDITINPHVGNLPDISGTDFTRLPEHARGGIATRATAGIFGEKGAEALIPLDRASDYGLGGPKRQTINVYMDGRVITSVVVENMPDVIDLHGGVK